MIDESRRTLILPSGMAIPHSDTKALRLDQNSTILTFCSGSGNLNRENLNIPVNRLVSLIYLQVFYRGHDL